MTWLAAAARQALPGAVALAAGAAVLAVLGLTPGLGWIPEVPLIAAGLLYPVLVCGVTGYCAAAGRRRLPAGALAGALAGAVGGTVGGICYVLYGKSVVNVPTGLVAGLVGGGLTGMVGALAASRVAATRE